ncbi:hypothetical protein ES703_18256 [subsurface metagenome]
MDTLTSVIVARFRVAVGLFPHAITVGIQLEYGQIAVIYACSYVTTVRDFPHALQYHVLIVPVGPDTVSVIIDLHYFHFVEGCRGIESRTGNDVSAVRGLRYKIGIVMFILYTVGFGPHRISVGVGFYKPHVSISQVAVIWMLNGVSEAGNYVTTV